MDLPPQLDEDAIEQLKTVVNFYYTITYLNGEVISQDSTLLHEWFWFSSNLPEDVKRFYTYVNDTSIQSSSIVWNTVGFLFEFLLHTFRRKDNVYSVFSFTPESMQ